MGCMATQGRNTTVRGAKLAGGTGWDHNDCDKEVREEVREVMGAQNPSSLISYCKDLGFYS